MQNKPSQITVKHLCEALRSAGSTRLRSCCDSIVDLRTIHAQRTVVVEQQPVESECAARSEGLSVESLRIVVDIDFNLAGIVQQRDLPLLHGQGREQIVGS